MNLRSANKPHKALNLLVLLIALVLVSPTRASAYTDPGTGMLVYQTAYAVFLGGTFYLRRFLDRFFRKPR